MIRDHGESFQARARRDDDTSSVVDGCAEPSVDGMASQESDVIAWRHRIRRRRARLAPSSSTLHRAPVGQGPSGPDWLAISFGFWSGRALATGTAWAGLCLIHHHH